SRAIACHQQERSSIMSMKSVVDVVFAALAVAGTATWRDAMVGVDVLTTDRYAGSANTDCTSMMPSPSTLL
ncbi:MAG: hypothetical protein OXQ28_13665, partial [Acidobacteriota bacterium]|nr:hypothetical protein [Acidobacteriota bacterium]